MLVLILLVQLDVKDGSYLAVMPYLVTFLLSVVCTWMASRRLGPAVGRARRDVPRIRTVHGGKVFDTAWPMLLQMIALPIAMQTDRIVLSHVSDLHNLAQYNLASQMYTPVWQVVSAAGVTLWPVFARARSGHGGAPKPQPIALAFGAAAAGVCLFISLLSPWLADVASNGTIKLPLLLLVSFSIFMIFQATKYPLGMFMTDARGLRYQAYMILTLLPVNVGLSWWLGNLIGAAGPVIGSAVGVLLCQVIANWVYVRRTQQAEERAQAGASTS
jgi:O-antigen/teichoic acid export membrane protein